MTTREAHHTDRAAVRSVAARALEPCLRHAPSVRLWGETLQRDFVDHSLPPPDTPGPRRHTLVAERDGVILGFGSVPETTGAPFAPLGLVVAPEHRGRGVGSILLSALSSLRSGPFLVRAFLGDPGTVAFYRHRDFREAECATEGRIDPARSETAAWIERAAKRTPAALELLAADTEGAPERAEIARLLYRLYRAIHPWAPPPPLSDDRKIAWFLGESLPGTTHCARLDGRLVGAGTLLGPGIWEDPELAHLVWLGVDEAEHPLAGPITEALLARCLAAAARLKRTVHVEINSAHEHLLGSAREVPGAELFEDLVILVRG